MANLTAKELHDAAMDGYFAAVDAKDMDRVLAGFHEDASLILPTAHQTFAGRDTEIRGMYEGFFATYPTVSHDGIEILVDESRQRVSAQFEAVRTTQAGKEERAKKCNFFHFVEGKIETMWIYMSDEITL